MEKTKAGNKKGYNNFDKFIENVSNAYQESRNVRAYNNCKNISRGRSHSCSSIFEDYVACLILEELSDINDIFIFTDQPFSVKPDKNKRTFTIYPDVLVCKKMQEKYKCFYMCDTKTDIGWIRKSLHDICDNKEKHTNYLCGKTIDTKDGKNKGKKYTIEFDNNLIYDIVIISDGNGLKGEDDLIKKLKDPKYRDINERVNCFLLSEGDHLNDYREKKNISKSKNDYDNWITRIRNSIK